MNQLETRPAQELQPVLAYLRRHVLANQCLIESIDKNMPPVPREVWAAEQAGEIVGIVMTEEFPHGTAAYLRVDLPEALGVMLRHLDSGKEYNFSVPDYLREALLERLADVTSTAEHISLTAPGAELRLFESPGEVRRLTMADKQLAERFPHPNRGPAEPPLSAFVEWADSEAESQVVFGLIVEGEVLSFVQFGRVIDNIWEVGMIRTRDEHRGKGFGKTVLSHATRQLLDEGLVPLYQTNAANDASIRTAQAVGYREICRTFGCIARLKGDNTG